jgi:hypothetical protein
MGTHGRQGPEFDGAGDPWPERLRRGASRSIKKTIAAGIEPYDRGRHLPRLIAIEPDRLSDGSLENVARIVARLARALRAERNRGRAGHWTYDLNRHIALKQSHAAERRSLEALRKRGEGKKNPSPERRRI